MPEPDLTLLLEAAVAAGEIARRYFKSSQQVWDKGDGQGPVTEADLAIDKMLKDFLLAARPDYGWLSEETEDDVSRLNNACVFIVDPIDGTRAFVAGETTFAHSLAIAHNGEVTQAVVYLPMREQMYQARAGGGAYLNGARISQSGRTQIDGATVLAATPQLRAELWPGGVPPVEKHFRSSLAYRMALVAEGAFDAMLTLRAAWEWDIAAGDLLCREAGAKVTDQHGRALKFNTKTPQCPGVLAASPDVHAGLMSHLHP